MEKEKILSTLSEQLGKTDFSQKTLELYVELNPVADGEEPTEAYFGKAVSFLKGMQGQYNHDVATKVEDFKKNYKPEPNPPIDPPKPVEPNPNKDVEDMKAQLKAMQEKLDAAEAKKSQNELMKQVKAGMKAKNATDDYVLEKTLQGVVLDSEKPVRELVDGMLEKYDAEFKACRGNGATPRTSTGGQAKKTALDDYFARKAKKEGWGKKD